MSKLDGRSIVKSIQNGEFSAATDNEIKKYLKGIQRADSLKDELQNLPKSEKIVIRFLLAFNEKFDLIPKDRLVSAAEIMLECIRCCRFQKDDEYLYKVSFHLINKFCKLLRLSEAVLLAECIYDEFVFQFENACDEKIAKYITEVGFSLSIVLSNLCNQIERRPEETLNDRERMVFEGRILSLQFQVFSGSNLSSVSDILSSFLSKISSLLPLPYVKNRLDTFVQASYRKLLKGTENSLTVKSSYLFEIYGCIFQYFMVSGAFNVAEETILAMKSCLKLETVKTELKKTDIDAMHLAILVFERITQSKGDESDVKMLNFCLRLFRKMSSQLDKFCNGVVRIVSRTVEIFLSVSKCVDQQRLLSCSEDDQEVVFEIINIRFLFSRAEFDFLAAEKDEADEKHRRRQLDFLARLASIKINKLRARLLIFQQKSELSKHVASSVSDLKVLGDLIDKVAQGQGIILPNSERASIIKLCYKWGNHLYVAGQYSDIDTFLKVCIKYYQSFSESDAKQLLEKFQISKCYEILVSASRKLNHMKDAQKYVLDGVTADRSRECLISAVKQWVKIQQSLSNNALANCEDPSVVRTLCSALKDCRSNGIAFDDVTVLQEELKMINLLRVGVCAYCQKVFDELEAKLDCYPVRRASILIERALHTITQKAGTDSSSKLLCQEAITVLQAVQDQDAASRDLLARANICLFAINEPDQVDKLMHSSQDGDHFSDPASSTGNDADEEDEDGNSETFPECKRSLLYSDHLKPLARALELWEACFSDSKTTKTSCKKILDSAKTVEFLEIMGIIFKLLQDVVNLSRTLSLLFLLSEELKDHHCCLWTYRQQIDLCLMLRQPLAADRIINQTEAWAIKNNVPLQEFARLYMEYLISKINVCIALEKSKEATAMLNDAKEMKGKLFKGKTKDSLIVGGMLSFVESKMVGLISPDQNLKPSEENSQFSSSGTHLENSVSGMRSFLTTLCFLFRENSLPGSQLLVERWLILELLVQSLLHTSRSYLRSGVRREAMFYLSQGLRFCQAFCLRKWFCQFHLELAHLHLLSDKTDECDAHIHRVNTMLGSEGKKHSSKTSFAHSVDVSSNTKTTEDSPDGVDNFLKTKSHRLDLQVVRHVDLGSSPISKTAELKMPKSWEDEVGCDCLECVDLPLRLLWMSVVIVESSSALRQRKQDCVKLAKQVLKKQEKFGRQADYVNNRFKLVSSFGGKPKDKVGAKKAPGKKAAKSDSSFDIFRPEFLRIHLLVAENALHELDMLTFKAHLDSARQLLVCSCHTVDDKVNFQAQIVYLSSVSTFSWPPVDEITAMSEIEWICASIGQKKVEEDITAGKILAKTPSRRRGGRPPRKIAASPSNSDDDRPLSCVIPPAPVKRHPINQPVAAPSKRKPRQISWKQDVEVMEIPPKVQPEEKSITRLISKLSLDDEIDDKPTIKVGGTQVKPDGNGTPSNKSLREAYRMLRHDPPAFSYRQVCHLLAVHCLKERDYLSAAFYFSEAQAVAFRHYCQLITFRKLSKMTNVSVEDSPLDRMFPVLDANASCDQLLNLKVAMMFGKTKGDFQKKLDGLTAGWTVCQLSVVRVAGHEPGRLYATRFEQGLSPVTVCLSGFSTNEGQKLLTEFDLIMKENQNSMLVSDRAEWWKLRESIDKRLQEFLINLDQQWLGCWRGIILGSLSCSEDRKKLKSAVMKFLKPDENASANKELVECLLSAAHLMSDREIAHALQVIYADERDVDVLRKRTNVIRCLSKELNLSICNRGVTMLILDKDIQHLPWESVPCLESLSITRFPSFHFLFAQLHNMMADPSSLLNFGIDKRSTFYLLNPDKTLNETQKAFEEWFQSLQGWTGVVARPPTNEELTTALVNKDLYVYCGHGAGKRYIPTDFLLSLNCHAAALLMGCSSGHLITSGEFEAWGTLLMFCLAGVPCVLANLWDVTDRDIDRYLESLLKTWLNCEKNGSIVDTRQSSRLACRFKYLIGAAPVIYGFPV